MGNARCKKAVELYAHNCGVGWGRYCTGTVYPANYHLSVYMKKSHFGHYRSVYHSLVPSIKITRGHKNERSGKEVKDLLCAKCTYFCHRGRQFQLVHIWLRESECICPLHRTISQIEATAQTESMS